MSLTKTIPNVVSIYPEDSQRQHGLQFADNICSVLRRYKSEDDLLFKPYDCCDINEKRKFNKVFDRFLNRYQLRELLLDIHPDLRIGYQLKENYIDFNNLSSLESAPDHIDQLIRSFIIADIPEYQPFLTAIVNWREEIIHSFYSYRGRRINNGVAESINAQIKLLLYNTRGIRNHERRRKRIMYAINKENFSIR